MVIIITSVQRFLDPQPLENVGVGLAVSAVASVLNGTVAFILIRAGRAHRSITLTADGGTCSPTWTSVGVIVGVLAVALTGWLRLDPLIAMAVGVNIVVTGTKLLMESIGGSWTRSRPRGCRRCGGGPATYRSDEVQFHEVRTRMAGHVRFVAMHVLVPGSWSVQQGTTCSRTSRTHSRHGSSTCASTRIWSRSRTPGLREPCFGSRADDDTHELRSPSKGRASGDAMVVRICHPENGGRAEQPWRGLDRSRSDHRRRYGVDILREVAGHLVPRGQVDQRRNVGAAYLLGLPASRGEPAAGRGLIGEGTSPVSRIWSRSVRRLVSGIGTADSSAIVYGCIGRS